MNEDIVVLLRQKSKHCLNIFLCNANVPEFKIWSDTMLSASDEIEDLRDELKLSQEEIESLRAQLDSMYRDLVYHAQRNT